MLIAAVFGRGFFYYLTIAPILLVLSLSANTAFADFPRLCRSIALDNYLAARLRVSRAPPRLHLRHHHPRAAHWRTAHSVWRHHRPPHSALCRRRISRVHAVAIRHGRALAQKAWPALAKERVRQRTRRLRHRHHRGRDSRREICRRRLDHDPFHSDADRDFFRRATPLSFRRYDHALHRPHGPEVPRDSAHRRRSRSITTARSLATASNSLRASPPTSSPFTSSPTSIPKFFTRSGIASSSRHSKHAGDPPPKLVRLPSPYRFVIVPIVQYILKLSHEHPDRRIIVVIPELAEGRWYEYFLHNQRGRLLEWLLLVKGNERIFTLNAPYYLGHHSPAHRSAAGPEASAVIDSLVEKNKPNQPSVI